jgi:hypothetical protein
LATMQLIGSIFSNVRADALIIFSILSFMPIINEHVHFPFNL